MSLAEITVDYGLVAALLLAVIHLAGPHIRSEMRQHHELVASFGGGLAVAYVFLQLFPEVELAHEWLDTNVHLVTLVSFLLFFGFEAWLHRRQLFVFGRRQTDDHPDDVAETDRHASRIFWWHVALSWFYTWAVIFALPEAHKEELGLAVLGSIAVGLHLIYKDFVLRSHHGEAFEAKGRYLLALAPLVGWVAHEIVEPPEHVFDLFIAVLAGVLIQGVFQNELPKLGGARLSWMYAGAAIFAVLSFVVSG